MIVGRGILIVVGLLGFMAVAPAHDHGEQVEWMKPLRSATGTVCCDGNDALVVNDDDWHCDPIDQQKCEIRMPAKGLNEFFEVPRNTVVDRRHNKGGEAYLWATWYFDRKTNKIRPSIRCFMPWSPAA